MNASPTLLHVGVSPRGAASHSRRAGAALVRRLRTACPELRVIERDLARQPLPHPDAGFVDASLTRADLRGPAHVEALALSETLLAEIEAADLIAIDTPMHNFTLPSALKAWIDYVVRPQRSFGLTPAGKAGLLRDRPVWVLVACGGAFGSGQQADFFTPYLRHVFATVGISQLEILRLENLNRGAAPLAQAFAAADAWMAKQVDAWAGGDRPAA